MILAFSTALAADPAVVASAAGLGLAAGGTGLALAVAQHRELTALTACSFAAGQVGFALGAGGSFLAARRARSAGLDAPDWPGGVALGLFAGAWGGVLGFAVLASAGDFASAAVFGVVAAGVGTALTGSAVLSVVQLVEVRRARAPALVPLLLEDGGGLRIAATW